MRDFLNKPKARFIAGFVIACFFTMPVMLAVVGFPESFLFLVPFVAAGIAGGVFFVRRPPPIYYKQPADILVHGPGIFRRPTARFLGGFFGGSLIFIAVMRVILGPPDSYSIIASTVAVGLVGGVIAARRSARIFW